MRIRSDLKPNTPEWLQWRKTVASASDACVIMGEAPLWYSSRTWDDLRLADIGLVEPPSDYALKMFAHGHEQEARCIKAKNLGRIRPWKPMLVESKCGRFGASLDGAVMYEGKQNKVEWLEVKSPYHRSSLYKSIRALSKGWEGIPRHFYWQLAHQTLVLGDAAHRVDILVWDAEDQSVAASAMPDMDELFKDSIHLHAKWMDYIRS